VAQPVFSKQEDKREGTVGPKKTQWYVETFLSGTLVFARRQYGGTAAQ